jgi:hypothetical protein
MTELEYVELAVRRASGKARHEYYEKKNPDDLLKHKFYEGIAEELMLINEEIKRNKQ